MVEDLLQKLPSFINVVGNHGYTGHCKIILGFQSL